MYYTLYFSEKDGILVTQFPSAEALSKEIENNDQKDYLTFSETKGRQFVDGGYYPVGKTLIIKGEVIEPRAAKLTI